MAGRGGDTPPAGDRMARIPDEAKATWLTKMAEHEGRPLALRVRPDADSAANCGRYPQVASVSHELPIVSANGLPEPNYNDSLAEFDHDLHATIERDGEGLVVVVETFSGKRNYFAYITDVARLRARVEQFQLLHPQSPLNMRSGPDPEWKWYNSYRQRFPW
jgi:hypothetical protein